MLEFFTKRDQLRNQFSSILSALHASFEDERRKTFNVLMPLDNLQQKIERNIHVLQLQLRLLNEWLEQEKIPDDMNYHYQEAFTTLRENLENSYKDLLDARDEIFEEDQFITLTLENRSFYFEKFKEKIAPELQQYGSFQFESNLANLKQQQERLTVLLTEQEKLMEYIMEQRTEKSMHWRLKEEFFIQRGTEIEEQRSSHIAAEKQSLYVLVAQGELTAIKLAIDKISSKTRKAVLDNIIEEGRSLLHIACLHGYVAVINYLLEMGADPQLKDQQGYTILHYLFVQQHAREVIEAILKLLTAKNKNVDVQGPYQRTPLHTAALFNNIIGAQILLKAGANVNAQEAEDSSQRTPLHNAAMRGHTDMIKLLLDYHADPHLKNKANESAIYEAILEGKVAAAYEFINKGFWITAEESFRLQRVAERSDKIKEALLRPLVKSLGHLLIAEYRAEQRLARSQSPTDFFQAADRSLTVAEILPDASSTMTASNTNI